jgi:hypothetical protein
MGTRYFVSALEVIEIIEFAEHQGEYQFHLCHERLDDLVSST